MFLCNSVAGSDTLLGESCQENLVVVTVASRSRKACYAFPADEKKVEITWCRSHRDVPFWIVLCRGKHNDQCLKGHPEKRFTPW